MTDSHDIRLERARQSLEGLSVADSLGMHSEFWRGSLTDFIKTRKPPEKQWRFTDDTNMALSIYSILRQFGEIRQDELAQSFIEHFDKARGYGYGASKVFVSLVLGEGEWRELFGGMFGGTGSFGNGGAMRIAPLGAYFADDIPTLIENAKLSAEVTHAHPEGIAGGIAVAVASAVAVSYRDYDKPTIPDFIDTILPHIPDSEVKENCAKAKAVDPDSPIDDVVMVLGNGRNVSAMDTVPLTLWCAANWMDDYEEAFWQCASAGGDVDTTCAIVGGIVASYDADTIPDKWIQQREPLPEWAFEEVTKIG